MAVGERPVGPFVLSRSRILAERGYQLAARWQQPQEILTGEGAGFIAFGLAAAVPEGDSAVVAGEDVLFLDHAPVEMASEIHQGLVAATDALAIDDPVLGMAGWQRQSGLGQLVEHS